jgi:hypothetical protein
MLPYQGLVQRSCPEKVQKSVKTGKKLMYGKKLMGLPSQATFSTSDWIS